MMRAVLMTILLLLLPLPTASARSLCGELDAMPSDLDATTWTAYGCLSRSDAGDYWDQCLKRKDYTRKRGGGCPGSQRCCPGDAVFAAKMREREQAVRDEQARKRLEAAAVDAAELGEDHGSGASAFAVLYAVFLFGGPALFFGLMALVLGLFLRGGGAEGVAGAVLGSVAGWMVVFAASGGWAAMLLGYAIVAPTTFIGAVIGLVIGVKKARAREALLGP